MLDNSWISPLIDLETYLWQNESVLCSLKARSEEHIVEEDYGEDYDDVLLSHLLWSNIEDQDIEENIDRFMELFNLLKVFFIMLSLEEKGQLKRIKQNNKWEFEKI